MPTLQEYLNRKYPTKEDKEKVKEIFLDWWEGLKITGQNWKFNALNKEEVEQLDGKELNLSEYPNLEKVDIARHYLKSKLTSLDVSNCSKLIELNCSKNQITNLNIQGCSKLEKLIYYNNPITDDNKLSIWQKTIHPDFTKELIKEWEKRGFDYRETKQWIQEELKLSEVNFAIYYLYKSSNPEWVWDRNLDQLREEFLQANWQDWTDIHKDFRKKENYCNEIYQQRWEKEGLTYQEASEWIQAGRKPEEFYSIAHWKNQGYTPETAQGKSHAQEWLEQNYPSEGVCQRKDNPYYGKKRKEIIKLDIREKNLNNSLLITNWSQLEWIDCGDNQLTNLTIANCSNLNRIDCYRNQLTNLELNNLPVLTILNCFDNQLTNPNFLTNYWESLTWLDINSNKLTDLIPFSQLVNCEELNLRDNSFTGSLAPLQNLSKLKKLNIINTQINSGLEYLPESLEEFYCKRTKLATELKIYGRPDNTYNNYLNPLQNWRNYPKWQAKGFSEQEIKQWIGAGLSYREYKKASFIKEQNISYEQFQKELKSFKGDYQLWKADYLQKQLELEKAKIPTFEKEILRLTNLIKSHKEKIIEAYTHFFTEKDLLKELITAHLAYTKAKQEKQPAFKLKKQCHKLSEELEEKIGEEQMEQVEAILHNCEELIHYEAELQVQINNNQKLISNHQQVINQITYHIENININKGHGFIGNQTIEEVLETKINNTQVGNVSFDNTRIEGSVAIGVGQITNQQAQIQIPPKSN